jgi:hypothetical protein
MAKARLLPLLVVTLVLGNAYALEASQVKRALDRGGNWLIEQYDSKEKVFGKGEQAKDLVTVGMCVAALCDNPRDYKETSGPFISEPVKYILSQIGDDGKLKGVDAGKAQPYIWVAEALIATRNGAYDTAIEKCRQVGRGSVASKADTPEIANLKWEIEFLRSQLELIPGPKPSVERVDAMIDGSPAGAEKRKVQQKEQAEARATELLKLQQKNGSFSEDVKAHAACLIELNRCYKALK